MPKKTCSETTSRSLRSPRRSRASALRSRDELRHQTAEAAQLDERCAGGGEHRRPLRAAQALCASLRTPIYELEGQVARGAAAELGVAWQVNPSPRAPNAVCH